MGIIPRRPKVPYLQALSGFFFSRDNNLITAEKNGFTVGIRWFASKVQDVRTKIAKTKIMEMQVDGAKNANYPIS